MKLLRLACVFLLISLGGCSYGQIYARHISHPLAGQPVTPSHDAQGHAVEGFINELGLQLGNCWGRVCVDHSIGYDLTAGCDACMRGGPLLYTGEIKFRIFGAQ